MGRLVEVVTRVMRMGARGLCVVLVDVSVAPYRMVGCFMQGGGQGRRAV
jgi:hypothetical protein